MNWYGKYLHTSRILRRKFCFTGQIREKYLARTTLMPCFCPSSSGVRLPELSTKFTFKVVIESTIRFF